MIAEQIHIFTGKCRGRNDCLLFIVLSVWVHQMNEIFYIEINTLLKS